ncbi:hypothetical protein ACFUTY_13335 [Streptomyces sp. NPDC057362]|uniref:hypothetical protein n=1 Tax=Streptomyces sp. NPDC057362 TaxID=3346106 RepID=UPI00363F53FE
MYEMKRLGHDAAELTALADHVTAHGMVLEMLAGPLPGPRRKGSTPRPAKASTAAGPRSSPTTCSIPSCGAARAGSPSSRSSPT